MQTFQEPPESIVCFVVFLCLLGHKVALYRNSRCNPPVPRDRCTIHYRPHALGKMLTKNGFVDLPVFLLRKLRLWVTLRRALWQEENPPLQYLDAHLTARRLLSHRCWVMASCGKWLKRSSSGRQQVRGMPR